MRNIKKLISIMLVFMVVMMGFPMMSFASNEVDSADGNWKYLPDYNNNTCTIIG